VGVEQPLLDEQVARKAAEFYASERIAIVWTQSRNGTAPARRFVGKGWQLTGPLEDVEDFVKRAAYSNPGINLRGSRLVGIEVDGAEQLARFEKLGISRPTMVEQSSTPERLHFYYEWPHELSEDEPVSFRFEGETVIAAVNNAYVCWPGTHPTGTRKWLQFERSPLADSDYMKLRQAAGVAKRKQRSRIEAGQKLHDGERHDFLISEAGRLRARDLSEADALAALIGIDALHCEPPMNETDPEELREMAAYPYGKDPLPEPVAWDGKLAGLLDDTRGLLRSYFVVGEAQTVFLALWYAHTYAIEQSFVTPYGWIVSPTKRCGKSNLLMFSSWACAGGWYVINPSTASLYQKFAGGNVTLCLDEIDTLYSTKKGASEGLETLRAVFNAGFMRGATVPRGRKDGGASGPDEFDVFSPKLFAGIGQNLPETIRDRSVKLRMERKTRKEPVRRFRIKRAREQARALAARYRAWAESGPVLPELDDHQLPPELDDRAWDIWEPLLAIADLAGGEWPARSRLAAIELSGGRDAEDEQEELALALLRDIVDDVFTGQIERTRTLDLITALCVDADRERPWREWWWDERESKPTKGAANRLSRLLRQFDIHSKNLRFEDGSVNKGYERAQFMHAWEHYLADTPENAATSATSPQPSQIQAVSEPLQDASAAAPKTAASPHEQRDVADVAASGAKKGETQKRNGEDAVLAEVEELIEDGVLFERDPAESEWIGTASMDEIRKRYEGAE
jgi:hypothetical protein